MDERRRLSEFVQVPRNLKETLAAFLGPGETMSQEQECCIAFRLRLSAHQEPLHLICVMRPDGYGPSPIAAEIE